MPLTKFQKEVAKLLASSKSNECHLAGGAALHNSPASFRYSNDLDYFHDRVELVQASYDIDKVELCKASINVEEVIVKEGFIRCEINKGEDRTKIEWVHDASWRFLPAVRSSEYGYLLHPIDLGVNKLLALVGREEPRDFLDVIYIHKNILPMKALIWAAVGKDPGFSPNSLLDIVRRRGKYREEDFSRLMLVEKVDLMELKETWLEALSSVEDFLNQRNPTNVGCLYYSRITSEFIAPVVEDKDLSSGIVIHHGKPGGREFD